MAGGHRSRWHGRQVKAIILLQADAVPKAIVSYNLMTTLIASTSLDIAALKCKIIQRAKR